MNTNESPMFAGESHEGMVVALEEAIGEVNAQLHPDLLRVVDAS